MKLYVHSEKAPFRVEEFLSQVSDSLRLDLGDKGSSSDVVATKIEL